MRKLKRILAMLLVTTMVFSGSVMAMAAEQKEMQTVEVAVARDAEGLPTTPRVNESGRTTTGQFRATSDVDLYIIIASNVGVNVKITNVFGTTVGSKYIPSTNSKGTIVKIPLSDTRAGTFDYNITATSDGKYTFQFVNGN